MDTKLQFKRTFLMLNQEDGGFRNGQEPSGYVKIELKDGRGKLSAVVQNLKEDPVRLKYKLYLIKCDGTSFFPVQVGPVVLKNSRGEVNWNFDPANVAASGIPIEAFNITAVVVDYAGRNGNSVICPLASYIGQKVNWKALAKDALYSIEDEATVRVAETPPLPVSEERENESGVLQLQEIHSKWEEYPAEIAAENDQESMEGEKPPVSEREEAEDELEILRTQDMQSKYEGAAIESEYKAGLPEFKSAEDLLEGSSGESTEIEDISEYYGTERLFETETGAAGAGDTAGKERSKGSFVPGDIQTAPASPQTFNPYQPQSFQPGVGNPAAAGGFTCNYMGTGICPPPTNNNLYNPCMNCPGHNLQPEASKQDNSQGDVEKLKEGLNKYFQPYNPFGSKKTVYKWWKVNSPVHLNNVLYQSNIKTPVLFNPKVMMAHFKYRHLIVGTYTDRMRRREYVVLGVPGVYSLDEKPFADLCRWVQLEGYRPKYGAFGYWLVYMDPKTGKLLKVN